MECSNSPSAGSANRIHCLETPAIEPLTRTRRQWSGRGTKLASWDHLQMIISFLQTEIMINFISHGARNGGNAPVGARGWVYTAMHVEPGSRMLERLVRRK